MNIDDAKNWIPGNEFLVGHAPRSSNAAELNRVWAGMRGAGLDPFSIQHTQLFISNPARYLGSTPGALRNSYRQIARLWCKLLNWMAE